QRTTLDFRAPPSRRKDNRKSQPLYDITVLAAPHLKRLSCSLTSGCDWSGESPDDGKFPVRPSSLTPSVVRQRAAPEAGVTMSSEGVVKCSLTLSRRSQSGGLGKRAGRNIKRTMQPRNVQPVKYCWQRRRCGSRLD